MRRLCRDVPVRSPRARRGRLRPRDGAHRPAPGPGRLGPSVTARHSLTARRPVPCPPCESSPRGCSRSAARLASTQSASLRPRRSSGLGRRSSSASARACTAAWRSPTRTRRARPIPMPRSRVRGRSSSGLAPIASRRRHRSRVARPRSVARYAQRDHYKLLGDGLRAVAAGLKAAGWKARVVVDDNALVDREAAHRAGLGWFGKSANILLPGRGSWFVLGSVVTDAPLDASNGPVDDGCGSCRRCIDSCPTGAIVAPGVVDARRCLAWLVQSPGVFPKDRVSPSAIASTGATSARRCARRTWRPTGAPTTPTTTSAGTGGRRPRLARRVRRDAARTPRPLVHPRSRGPLPPPQRPDHPRQHRRWPRARGRGGAAHLPRAIATDLLRGPCCVGVHPARPR